MSYQIKKKTQHGTYVYLVESYWDKEKRQPRQRSKYIGKEDSKTGNVKPVHKGKLEAKSISRVLDYGQVTLCREIAKACGLTSALEKAFAPDVAETLFLLAVFLITEQMPLCSFESWAGGVYHNYTGRKQLWTSKGLSGLLQELGSNAQSRLKFSKEFIRLNKGNVTGILLDISSISTYSGLDGFASWGYNRDGENIPQVNVELAVLEPGGIPVTMRITEGSVTDVSTLLNAVKLLKSCGVDMPETVIDRGYFSGKNLGLLSVAGSKVIIPVPSNCKIFKEAVNSNHRSIIKAENAFTVGDDTMFHLPFETAYDGREYVGHLYLNMTRKSEETNRLYAELEKTERAFNFNKPRFKREATSILWEMLPKTRARLLKLVQMQDGSWNVQRKPKAIARYANRLGFMLLLTDNRNKSGQDMLMTYRSRDAVEKLFDNLKNALNNDRLRIHSSKAAEGKIFLALVAMILHVVLQQRLEPSKREFGRRLSPREALLDFRKTKALHLPDGEFMIYEISKRQRRILQLLGVQEDVFTSKPHSGKKIPI